LLESRPLYEGVSFASTLLSHFQSHSKTSPVKITLYPDAAAALASPGIDVLLLGADRITASGAVSNKTGSLPATLSVRHISPAAKVVVLSELEKVAEPDQSDLHVVEENDITEIVGGWQHGKARGLEIIQGALQGHRSMEDSGLSLKVKNIYFEWVPPELVDAYICENGVQGVSEIQARSRWVGQQAERLFGGL
jgi:translation initiation factor 2B subunit (eIF-2B alpha/beta/delta family)